MPVTNIVTIKNNPKGFIVFPILLTCLLIVILVGAMVYVLKAKAKRSGLF